MPRSYGTVRIPCNNRDLDSSGSGKGGKKPPIRIDPDEYKHRSNKLERAFTKQDLKVDKTKLFLDPIIELNDEQNKRYEALLDFCRDMSKCVNGCKGYIKLTNYSATPGCTGIRARCGECINYTTDESKQARDHAEWLNSVMQEYGMDFQEGLPKLVKHEIKGRWCANCRQNHNYIEWYDYRPDDD
jgi:hypothetical protein